jgi:tetratricopeptide (TPR) repeat protein
VVAAASEPDGVDDDHSIPKDSLNLIKTKESESDLNEKKTLSDVLEREQIIIDPGNKTIILPNASRIPLVSKKTKKADEQPHNDKEIDDEEEVITCAANLEATTTEEEEKLREEANAEKERGNQHVKAQRWTDAIECYTKAIQCCPSETIFYSNRALCHLKTGNPKAAMEDCTSAINIDPKNVKAYFRRGQAQVIVGLWSDAKRDFETALEKEPRNDSIQQELNLLKEKIEDVLHPKYPWLVDEEKGAEGVERQEASSEEEDDDEDSVPHINTCAIHTESEGDWATCTDEDSGDNSGEIFRRVENFLATQQKS